MKMSRKIQWAATAVVANGALALNLLTPTQALAVTCTDTATCTPQSICQWSKNAFCTSHLPPGCVLVAAACSWPGSGGCTNGYFITACNYEPA